jgi:hypothetical protein
VHGVTKEGITCAREHSHVGRRVSYKRLDVGAHLLPGAAFSLLEGEGAIPGPLLLQVSSSFAISRASVQHNGRTRKLRVNLTPTVLLGHR